MLYTLNLCPKCKDKLVEQDIEREEDYKTMYCPNCGRELILAFEGEEKVEDAEDITYKIVLNEVIIDEMRDTCVKVLMEIGNIDEKEALEKYNTENSVISEGDLLHTYLSLWLLGVSCYYLDYTVIPPLPYKSYYAFLCPDCGEVATYKEDKFFCENCNEWLTYGPL